MGKDRSGGRGTLFLDIWKIVQVQKKTGTPFPCVGLIVTWPRSGHIWTTLEYEL